MLHDIISDEQELKEYLAYHVRDRLAEGLLPDRIADELNLWIRWPHESRLSFVHSVQEEVAKVFKTSPAGCKARAPSFKTRFLYGVLWLTVGLVLAGAIYLKSAPLSLYLISLGAALWGMVEAVQAFIGVWRSWGP